MVCLFETGALHANFQHDPTLMRSRYNKVTAYKKPQSITLLTVVTPNYSR
jgi:hypothetical protein